MKVFMCGETLEVLSRLYPYLARSLETPRAEFLYHALQSEALPICSMPPSNS